MTDEEVAARMPVWHAMATLFLDTEPFADDYVRIATALKAASLSIEEGHCIFEREVAPAFGPNLLSVAGAWGMWSDDDLLRAMQPVIRRAGFIGVQSWLVRRLLRRHLAREWAQIVAAI